MSNGGYNKPFKLCVLASDLKALCKDLNLEYNEVETNAKVYSHKSGKNTTNRSEFGLFFQREIYINQGKTAKDVAADLNVDARRISECLKATVPKEPAKQELLERLKEYSGWTDKFVQSYGNRSANGESVRLFSDLTPKEKEIIVYKAYNSAKNKNAQGDKIYSVDYLYRLYNAHNQMYGYTENLTRVSLNTLRDANNKRQLLVETKPYRDIVGLSNAEGKSNAFTVTIFRNDAATARLIDTLKGDDVLFSFWKSGENTYQLHIVNSSDELSKFYKASVKAQFPFLNRKGEIQEGLKKAQDSQRAVLKEMGESYPSPYETANAEVKKGSGEAL